MPKTVKDVDAAEQKAEQAIKDLFEILQFLDDHPTYRLRDYVQSPAFKGSALAKLVG